MLDLPTSREALEKLIAYQVPEDIHLDYCVFRPNPATDSDASRPPIPTERGH